MGRFIHQEARTQAQYASMQEAAEVFQRGSERLLFAMDVIDDGIWDWDIPTGKVYCNQAYFRMLGYTFPSDQTDYSTWIDLIHPADQAHAWVKNQECVDGLTEAFEIEVRMRHRDGSWRWIRNRGNCPKRDETGRALRMVGIHTDITEKKQAEEALKIREAELQESEAKYRVMFEKANDAFIIEDLDGRVLDCNDAACRMFGYTREELLRLTIHDFVSERMHKTFPEQIKQLTAAGKCFMVSEDCRKNGEVFPVEVNLVAVTIAGEPRLMASIHDISEAKRTEKVQAALYQISEAAQSVADLGELYERIHTIIGGLMMAKNFYIALYDEEAGLLSFPYCIDEQDPTPPPNKPGRGMTEYVLRSGKPLLACPEVYHRLLEEGEIEVIGSPSVDWLGVPLKDGEKTFGMMAVQSYTQDVRYTGQDQEMLMFISAQVANAIRRKRADEQIRQLNNTLHSISQVNQSLVRAGNEGELMRHVCRILCESGGYPLVWIGLFEQDEACTVRPAVIGGDDCGYLTKAHITYGMDGEDLSPTCQAVKNRSPLLRQNLASGSTGPLPGFEVAEACGYASCVILPLVANDQAFGALYVYAILPDSFKQEEVALLSQMADDLAFGILALREREQRQQAVAALSESEEKYRNVVERANDGITILLDGRVAYANPSLAEMWGGKAEEVIGRPFTDIVNSAELEKVSQRFKQRKAGKAVPATYTTLLQRQNGTAMPAEINVGLLNYQGKPAELVIIRDVTEQQNAEAERLKRLAELEAVNRISTALRTTENLDEMLPRLLDETLAVINTTAGAIWLYDSHSGELRPKATRGWLADLLPSVEKNYEGIGGIVFTTGKIYRCADFATDPNTRPPVRDLIPPGWRGACIPIYSTTERVGIVIIAVKAPRELKEEDIHLLTNLAEIAGNAIHRMRLHAQAELHVQRLNALRVFDMAITTSLDLHLTLDVLLDQATHQLGVDAADVLLYNKQTKKLEYAAGRGFRTSSAARSSVRLGEGLAGRAAQERKILQIIDPAQVAGGTAQGWLAQGEKFRTYYGVPLISKGSIEGVLEIFHRDTLTPDPEWREFLETLAGQAAIAIDDAQLFQNLQRSNTELRMAYDIFIEGLSRTLELRHLETQGHSKRVTGLTLALAREMRQFNDEELVAIRRGAILHDIGKICVPDSILLKPARLDTQEWSVMRKHPEYANDMLAPIGYLGPAVDIPYCHHEKWDGSGYPRGLIGEQIPLTARIFAVIDVWDALTHKRVYQDAWEGDDVRDYIASESGKHFDPQVVDAFLRYLDRAKQDLSSPLWVQGD